MIFIKQLERYKKLDELIKQEETGTPKKLANELKISRSHLYRIIDFFREYGADISYSRKKRTFYYTKPFNISNLGIQSKLLDNDGLQNISGGFYRIGSLNEFKGFPLTFKKFIIFF